MISETCANYDITTELLNIKLWKLWVVRMLWKILLISQQQQQHVCEARRRVKSSHTQSRCSREMRNLHNFQYQFPNTPANKLYIIRRPQIYYTAFLFPLSTAAQNPSESPFARLTYSKVVFNTSAHKRGNLFREFFTFISLAHDQLHCIQNGTSFTERKKHFSLSHNQLTVKITTLKIFNSLSVHFVFMWTLKTNIQLLIECTYVSEVHGCEHNNERIRIRKLSINI